MQRQHKYIVYIQSKKYMGKPRTLFEMTEGHGDISAYPNDTIFREWTGLKDKNGKELYEGDILKIGPQAYSVVWDDIGEHGWKLDTPHFHLGGAQSIFYEVVGNIYENPELLTQ